MKTPLPSSAALTLALCLAAPSVRAADDTPIRTLIAEQTAAWNQRNAQAWARDFSPDADFINILGMHFQGRTETQARHAYLFGGVFKDSQLAVTVQKVRLLSPGSAVAETLHELRGYTRLPPGIQPTDGSGVLRTRMKYVFVQTGGQWQIVSAQNTAISPPPP